MYLIYGFILLHFVNTQLPQFMDHSHFEFYLGLTNYRQLLSKMDALRAYSTLWLKNYLIALYFSPYDENYVRSMNKTDLFPNNFQNIGPNTFRDFWALEVLILSSCNIEYLDPEFLQSCCDKLSFLALNDNNIKIISSELMVTRTSPMYIKGFMDVKILVSHSNPLLCDCENAAFFHYAISLKTLTSTRLQLLYDSIGETCFTDKGRID
ncbi:unnamed protein product [Gordionus sp. m RMFG-2023]